MPISLSHCDLEMIRQVNLVAIDVHQLQRVIVDSHGCREVIHGKMGETD